MPTTFLFIFTKWGVLASCAGAAVVFVSSLILRKNFSLPRTIAAGVVTVLVTLVVLVLLLQQNTTTESEQTAVLIWSLIVFFVISTASATVLLRPAGLRSFITSFLGPIIFTVVLVGLILFARQYTPVEFVVTGPGMEPLYPHGSYVVTDLWAGTVGRGDVVIYRHPVRNHHKIARIAALGGDTVAVEDGIVKINGSAWHYLTYTETYSRVLEDHELFVLYDTEIDDDLTTNIITKERIEGVVRDQKAVTVPRFIMELIESDS